MHRMLIDTKMPHIDHRNGDSLDNRHQNLRPSTNSSNIINSKVRSDSKTGYKNITVQNGKFRVEFWRNKIKKYIGVSETLDDAICVRDAYLKNIIR